LRAGFLLLVPVTAYLLSHQLIHRHRRWRAPKEMWVAALFGCGVSIFVVVRPEVRPASLALPLGSFVLLCFANCALISGWERDVDRSQGQTSLALQFRHTDLLNRALPWLLAALSTAAALSTSGPVRVALACAAASAALLGAVDLAEPRMGPRLARVLADVALMTPALPLAAAWLR
jgi:4-hydroxybenzoate polyprenyltransferase